MVLFTIRTTELRRRELAEADGAVFEVIFWRGEVSHGEHFPRCEMNA